MTKEPENKVTTVKDTVPQVEKKPVQPVYVDPKEAKAALNAGSGFSRSLWDM